MARIRVYQHDSNPERDSPDYHISKSTKKSMLKHGRAVELADGSLQLKPPFKESMLRQRLVVYRDVMYLLPHMEHSAMNRGAAGQNVAHYPVPAAYEPDMARAEYQFCPPASN